MTVPRAPMWLRRATSTSLLSAPVIGGYAVVGVVPVVATIPAGNIPWSGRSLWFVVAAVAQVCLVIISLVGSALIGSRSGAGARLARILVVALAGAARGLAIVLTSEALGVEDPSSATSRIANSTFSVVVWMLALSILVDAQRTFRRDFRQAFERDIAIAATTSMDTSAWESVDDEVQRLSAPVRQRIQVLRDPIPDEQSSDQVVRETADAIRELVATRLRPLSHRLWFKAAGQAPRVRLWRVAIEAVRREVILTPWLVVLLVGGMAIGSVVRYGMESAAVAIGVLTGLAGAFVWIERLRHRRVSSGDDTVDVALRWNLVSVPAFTLSAAFIPTAVSHIVTGAGADALTIVTIIIGIPAFALVVAMARVTSDDRQELLAAMRDPEVMREAVRRVRQQEAATYLHNHVKSALTASAMRMREAVQSDDAAGVQAAAQAAHDVLSRPIPDAIVLGRQSPLERLHEVADSWSGIAEVELELLSQLSPDDLSRLPDSALVLLADVLAEAIANAVRSGDATRVVVTGELEETALNICITDDGRERVDAVAGGQESGLGTAWLDSMIPGLWDRRIGPDGCRLTVTIPVAQG